MTLQQLYLLLFTGGILTFLILEKIFEYSDEESSHNNNNGDEKRKKIVGYLNLLANCIDNFIHGLAVASRYQRMLCSMSSEHMRNASSEKSHLSAIQFLNKTRKILIKQTLRIFRKMFSLFLR